MNKNLILFIMIICIVCGCQTVTSTHNIPQDNVQHDSLVYPIENSTPAPMPEPMPAPMPEPMPVPMPEPMPVPVPIQEAQEAIIWKPIEIDLTDEPTPIPEPGKVDVPAPIPVPEPPVIHEAPVKVQTPNVVKKDKLWHIRTVSYADNAYNDVLAKKTKKLLEKNGISDVVIKKASNSKKTKSYIVVDAGSFETKTGDDAKEMQKKLHNLEDNKKKPFKDAFFVKYQ